MTIHLTIRKDDEHGLGGGYFFSITAPDGKEVRIPRAFTPQTDSNEVQVFFDLLVANEATLLSMCQDYHAMIEHNTTLRAAGGQGRNWPIFSRLMRVLNEFQKKAGIVDT